MLAEYHTARVNMIECQLRPNKIINDDVIGAIENTPREIFLPSNLSKRAYSDRAVDLSHQRQILSPLLSATMVQALRPKSQDFALVLGGSCGYEAAILAQIIDAVLFIDPHQKYFKIANQAFESLQYDHVIAFHQQIDEPIKDEGPYDIILVAGGCQILPENIISQMSDNGRLVYIDHSESLEYGHVILLQNHHGIPARHVICEAQAPILPKCNASKKEFIL